MHNLPSTCSVNYFLQGFLDLCYNLLISHFFCSFRGKQVWSRVVFENTHPTTVFCFKYSIWKLYIGFPILECMLLNNTWMFKDWMKHFTYTVLHHPEQCTQPLDSIYYSLNWSYWVSPAASKWVSPQRDSWEWRPAALELPFCCCVIYCFQFTQFIIVNCISQSATLWALVSMNHYFLLWKQGWCACHDPTWLQSVHNK